MKKLSGLQRILLVIFVLVFLIFYYIGPYWSLIFDEKSNWRFLSDLVMLVHIPIIHTYKFIFGIEGMVSYAELRFFWALSVTLSIAIVSFLVFMIVEWIIQGFDTEK